MESAEEHSSLDSRKQTQTPEARNYLSEYSFIVFILSENASSHPSAPSRWLVAKCLVEKDLLEHLHHLLSKVVFSTKQKTKKKKKKSALSPDWKRLFS